MFYCQNRHCGDEFYATETSDETYCSWECQEEQEAREEEEANEDN